MSDDLRERRLAAFQKAQKELEAGGAIASLNDWCVKAGVGWSTVNDFLIGKTSVMSDRTYAKLASAAGWSVQRLKGEPEPIKLTDEEREFIELLRSLDPADRRKELRSLRARIDDEPPPEAA